MREELAKIAGQRRRFEAVFERFGKKTGYKCELTTILLKDVRDLASGRIVTDHLWFTDGKRFQTLQLQPGDHVRFEARVTEYLKGYRGRQDEDEPDYKPVQTDFRLSFPTKMMKWTSGFKSSEILVGYFRRNRFEALLQQQTTLKDFMPSITQTDLRKFYLDLATPKILTKERN
jgi:hypothetical protein